MKGGHVRLTPEERAHLQRIEQWSTATRAAMQQVRTSKFWPRLQKAAGVNVDQDPILDNVDWLIAMLKKLDRPTASDLIKTIEQHQRSKAPRDW